MIKIIREKNPQKDPCCLGCPFNALTRIGTKPDLNEWARTFCLFVCLFQWTPSFKEGGEYPLGWDLAHVLRPNRPHYHPEVGSLAS